MKKNEKAKTEERKETNKIDEIMKRIHEKSKKSIEKLGGKK